MHANTGDWIVVEGSHDGQRRRKGEVVKVVPGDGGREHYRVRCDDGHESIYFPGSDCHVVFTGETRSNWPLWS